MSRAIEAPEWQLVKPEFWPWPDFSPKEMAERSEGWDHGTSPVKVDPELMERLQILRYGLGFPLPVTSGYRGPDYNARVSSTGHTGPHTSGRAADISIHGERAHILLEAAFQVGFTGIGVNQKGPQQARFVHLDILAAGEAQPRPRVWSY